LKNLKDALELAEAVDLKALWGLQEEAGKQALAKKAITATESEE